MPTIASTAHQPPFIEGWLTLSWAFHTYFLICSHKRLKGRLLKCILNEVKDYYLDLLSGSKAFPITHFFLEKGKNWFNFSDKCADSETFRHSASISSLQRDWLKNSWVTGTMEQAFWVQIRKGSLQLSIILEIKTDSSDTTEMTKQ